ncbi:MAG: hypothetical protein HC861_07575, partial [Rhodospirillaceae bacterium]|nr:hypothetical protein [Rhodospirillaceae bacterium]
FPIASPGDFESVRKIAQVVRGATICGLARCNDKDIDRAGEALQGAPEVRIHVFLATSAIHREFKLRMDKEEILARAVAGEPPQVRPVVDVEHDLGAGLARDLHRLALRRGLAGVEKCVPVTTIARARRNNAG